MADIYAIGSAEETSRVVLIPVPFEATTSYRRGTARGPASILRESVQVDLYDLETGSPDEAGIYMLDPDPVIAELDERAGEAVRRVVGAIGRGEDEDDSIAALRREVNAAGDEVEKRVYDAVRERLERGQVAGVIGGDHSVALGGIRAYADRYGSIGILHVDAHADLRRAYQGFVHSHASIMSNVLDCVPNVERLVQVAIRDVCKEEVDRIEGSRDRVHAWYDTGIARDRMRGRLLDTFAEIAGELPERVYVSFDIDGLDPALCPRTGTPVPGGLDLAEASALLEAVVDGGRRIVGFDLCEVGDGEWDGNVGARVLYKLIGWTLKSLGAS